MEILKEGHKVLRQKAKRVDKIDDTIRNVCCRMVNLMLESGGIGLSGNQIGLLKRIIVVVYKNEPLVMINPEIINQSEEVVSDQEGCLSVPETFVEKKRFKTITVKYRDRKGYPHLEKYSDLTARIIQHEIDHLNGVLMIDQ